MTKTHLMTGSPEHQAWVQMRQRCYNPNNESYPSYGGRGIGVAQRWQIFENFYADMGPKPSPDHSNERDNNDRWYGPENCYWGTAGEQNNNTRRNRPYTHNGRTQNLSEWAREVGIDHTTILKREKLHWSIGQMLGFYPPPFNPNAHDGSSIPRKLPSGVNYTTYKWRINAGWPEEDARLNLDGRADKRKKHPKYIYVSHPKLGDGEFTIQQAAKIVGKKPNTVTVSITRRGTPPLVALGLEEK